MNRKLLRLLAMILCLFSLLSPEIEAAKVSVEATVPVPPAVEITDVSYWPVPYDPTAGLVTISFHLSKPASVSLKISDMFGSFVNFLGPFSNSAGPNVLFWDGKNLAGRLVKPAWYFYSIYATDGLTSDEETRVMAVSYGEPLIIRNLTPEPRRFRPSGRNQTSLNVWLSRDALVNVVIKTESGEEVRSAPLTLWPQGLNSFVWDGKNEQGQIVNPGEYFYMISGEDSGGNFSSISGTVWVLKRQEQRSVLQHILRFLWWEE